MTLGETLLNLTIEYQDATEAREEAPGLDYNTREPSVIAAEYEDALSQFLAARQPVS